MGLIVKGEWVDEWYPTEETEGEFIRQESRFRNTISSEDGATYQPEKGRYHLYVSLACPWAHRTLIFRKIKQLEDIITVSIVEPKMLENGWEFGEQGDSLYGLQFMYQLYLKAAPDYQGRVTVPVLWDKKTETIVNNESAEIIRILNTAFNDMTGNHVDYYPEAMRGEIDSINERIYETINNGVYRAGFATTQAAYEDAYIALFESLDWLEERLSKQRYLVGDSITEADWRLFTTLIRFDAVYHGHFKCNRQKLNEFSNISHYLRELYQVPGVKETIDLEYTKIHYYGSHKTINPTGVIPLGPDEDFSAPHNRL
ncbi:glutathione S-transferase family protein [Alkalimarinus alittae]|uniref:Glutathione S-transferase family protein n=1 Tax=Alkalimarinus alittae TaxID=2961619 RepID=A0ABY6N3G9_9ALTE|nr:glutathione S-transferase family protein [Alkalimarinus alittae]UZE96658.1 glutathione S-transferase family protein [Alkalimarinus alittae]